jgi:serine/threonine protein kinase
VTSDRERIGRYELISTISQGGMGSVSLARDPQLNRQVAVKLLLETLDSEEWRRRFQREAKALARLDHPNIVTIFDFGEDDRGRPFIVMEYVRGRHLGELATTPLSLIQKLTLLEQLCIGLECAHQAGIAHLDVKPANLIVDASGRLRIVDFGIARGLDSRHTRPTAPDARSGTPSYMAPEQILGETIGPRADQFATGAVAYELISGRRAFEGTLREVVAKICAADPLSLSQVCPGLDPALEAVVVRALSKQPQNRFPSMAAMGQSLAEIRGRLDSHNSPTITSVAASPQPSGQTTLTAPLPTVASPRTLTSPLFGEVAQEPPPRRTSRAPLLIASAAVVVIGLFGFAVLWRDPTPASPPPTGQPTPQQPDKPGSPFQNPGEVSTGGGRASDQRNRGSTGQDSRRQREIERVTRVVEAGGRDAVDAIESALKQYPSDPDLTALLTRVETRVRDNTARQHQAAIAAGATASPSFAAAVETERAALDLARQGMTATAIRKLWDADEQFATALEWKADTSSGSAGSSTVKAAPETENAVRTPLMSLTRAYSTLSAAAVKAAYPGLSADEARALDRSFLDYSAYRLDVQIVRTMFRGGRATVECGLEATVTLRSGEQRRSTSSATFVMQNTNGVWVILSASRLPN